MLLSNYRLAKSIGTVLKPVAAMAVPFAVQLSTPPAFAVVIRGFSGDFAPAQWSETSTDSAFVDASLVPDQLTLKSPDGAAVIPNPSPTRSHCQRRTTPLDFAGCFLQTILHPPTIYLAIASTEAP